VVESVATLITKKDTLLHQELDCPMDTLRMHTQLLCYFCLGDVDEVFFMTWGTSTSQFLSEALLSGVIVGLL
jgi:hypothetical protein